MTEEELLWMLLGQQPEGVAGKLAVQDWFSGMTPEGDLQNPRGVLGNIAHTSGGSTPQGVFDPFTGRPKYNFGITPESAERGEVYRFAPTSQTVPHMQPAGNRARIPGQSPELSSGTTNALAAIAPNEAAITPEMRHIMGLLATQLNKGMGLDPARTRGHSDVQYAMPGEGQQTGWAFGRMAAGGPPPNTRPAESLETFPRTAPGRTPPIDTSPEGRSAYMARALPVEEQLDQRTIAFNNEIAALMMPPGGGEAPVAARGVAPPTQPAAPVTPKPEVPASQQPPAQVARADVRTGAGTGSEPGWREWLSSPVNRAALIQFGANMIVPSYGGVMGQLAAGLGGAAEAMAATQKQVNADELAQRELESRERHQDLERKNRLQIAQTGAESRANVANIRGQYALQRAQSAGVRSNQEMTEYMKTYRAAMLRLDSQSLLGGLTLSEEEKQEHAHQEAMREVNRARALFGPGAGPRQNAAPGPSSSEIPAPGVPPSTPQGPGERPLTGQNEAPTAPRPFDSIYTPRSSDETQSEVQVGTVGKGSVQATTRRGTLEQPQARNPTGGTYAEGTTATAPNGQRVIVKGGKWVPMEP